MNPYIPLLFLFAFAGMIGGGLLLLSHLLGRRRKIGAGDPAGRPYECGLDGTGSTRQPLTVKFYLVAMLFILFDVEVVFLYPWAVLFKEFVRAGGGVFLFVEMAIFLGILVVGLVYIYGRRAIEWD